MKIENFKDAVTHFNYLSFFPKEDTSYLIHPELVVYYSLQEQDCNINYCKEHNISVYGLNRLGGTIVANKGDFTYIHISNKNDHFNIKFMTFLQKKLKALNINLIQDNNDLLLPNNKKFCGMIGKDIRDYYLEAGHISLTPDIKMIENICLKKSTKQVGGLAAYNITSEMIEDWFREFCFKEI